MHISKLCFVVFCCVPNSGITIQMRRDEDFLPREAEKVYARQKSVMAGGDSSPGRTNGKILPGARSEEKESA